MNHTLAEIKIQGTWLLLSMMILATSSQAAPRDGGLSSGSIVTGPAIMLQVAASSSHSAAAPAAHAPSAPAQHSSPAPVHHATTSPAPHAATGGTSQSKPSAAQHSDGQPTTSQGSSAPKANQTGHAQHPSTKGESSSQSSVKGSAASGGNHQASRNVEKRPDGSTKVTHSSGTSVVYDKNNRMREVTTRGGAVAKIGSSGRVSVIQAKNTRITYGPHGRTGIETVRTDRSRVVTVGHHYGFVEHPYTRNGRAYVSRTYVVNGHTYAHSYSAYYYHGAYFYHYVPAYYYGPAFYGWAYYPWAAPVYWGWGWYGAPWYTYFGYYFAPAPYYADASLWLTDYLLAQSLQAAYVANASKAAATQSANQSEGSGAPVSAEMKQAIAEEVKAQLAAERDAAAASQPATGPQPANSQDEQVPDALDPRQRTFLVFASLDERTSDGTDCALTPGDVLTRIDDSPAADQSVNVMVSHSKNKDCRPGSQVKVAVQDLQEMRNSFREQIDQGLQTLAQHQGSKGLPPAPDTKPHPSADGQAVPDLNAGDDLQRQLQQAKDAEAECQLAARQVS